MLCSKKNPNCPTKIEEQGATLHPYMCMRAHTHTPGFRDFIVKMDFSSLHRSLAMLEEK